MPPSASVRLVTCPEPFIEELASDASDLEFHDLTLIDSFDGFVNMVSQSDFALDTTDYSASSAYMECVERFDFAYSDLDDSWTYCDDHCISTDDQSNMSNSLHCNESSPSCIRAFGFSEPKSVEVVLDSGADGSVLPLEFGNVGLPDKDFDGSKYIDAQGMPMTISGARIAEVRFGPVVFRERFIIATVTSPFISMGRLLKDGWHLQNNGDGTMELVRKQRHIPVHFKRNSLCASGVIRMLSENVENTSASSPSFGQVCTAEHVRALTLGRAQVPPVAAAAEAALADDVPAAEDAELAVADRPEGVETTEVWVDGVKLDHSSLLRTLRSACESLGLVKSGGKTVLLERLWNHLQTPEMLAAHAAQHQLQGEMSGPVYSQPVPDEPTAEEVDNMEMYEYDCDEKDDGGASTELAPSDVLKRLCVPYSTFEPELEPAKLLELDLLADELEISRLKSMGVLLPVSQLTPLTHQRNSLPEW
eukprot:s972_g17.t1